MSLARSFGSDGFNSIAHVALGAFAAGYFPAGLAALGLYQVAQGGANTLVDLAEISLGALLGYLAFSK